MVAFPDGIGMDEARELVGPGDQLHDKDGFKLEQPPKVDGCGIVMHFPSGEYHSSGCDCDSCAQAADADTPETIIARTLQDLLCGGQPITTELMVNTIVTDLRIAGWLPQEDD